MQDEARKLWAEVEALPKRGQRRLYTADLRRRVVAFIERRIAAGISETNASAELGINQATVADWRGRRKTQAKNPTRVRAVEIVESHESSKPVLILGASARVEGLSVADVLTLVKGLR